MRQLRKLKELAGYHLNARDGVIGELKEVYFDDHRWTVRYLVVHTGNWLFGKDALIIPKVIQGVDEENLRLDIGLNRRQIEQAPPIDSKQPVSRHYEKEYHRHYGWKPYWDTDSFLGIPSLDIPSQEEKAPMLPEHPHLRSSKEVTGYHIQAQDDEIGTVEDFILDDKDWIIRYLVIDTGKWLPGKKVLVSPAWIQKIDWTQDALMVNLDSNLIQSAPKYDASKIISRDDELALYKHYGKAHDHV